MAPSKPDETPAGLEVSLVRDDLPYRAQRAIGLIPKKGLGIGRRALLLALITYAPIAVWAWTNDRALSELHPGEALLQHFGVTVRCLIAIPLLVIAEAVAQAITQRLVPYFVSSGLVVDAERARFEAIVRGVVRLRNQSLPWILIGGAIVALLLLPTPTDQHELAWAVEGAAKPHLGFGGFWFLYVARPIFIGLLLAWLWRLLLLFLLMSRIAKLDLALVPTHPDRAGGLGFLQMLPAIFSLVVLAVSAVLASHWGHDVLYHETDVRSLFPLAGVFVALMLLLFIAPLLPFGGNLRAAKRNALLDYGALVGRHGREVRRRWILGEPVEDPLLAAPEIGPVADTATLYDSVTRLRALPIGKPTLFAIILPALLPMLPVLAVQFPIKDILLKLLKALA